VYGAQVFHIRTGYREVAL